MPLSASPYSTKNLILVALFAALTAVGAFIRVPVPFVPFTLQFFFCALAGLMLGARLAFLSQLLYVAIGLAGLPVFTAGGGPGYVFQPTFGYLLGFIAAAWVMGRLAGRLGSPSFFSFYGVTLAGLAVVYLAGVPWLFMISRFYLGQDHGVWWALFYGFFSSVGGDLGLSVLIAVTARRVLSAATRSGLLPLREGVAGRVLS